MRQTPNLFEVKSSVTPRGKTIKIFLTAPAHPLHPSPLHPSTLYPSPAKPAPIRVQALAAKDNPQPLPRIRRGAPPHTHTPRGRAAWAVKLGALNVFAVSISVKLWSSTGQTLIKHLSVCGRFLAHIGQTVLAPTHIHTSRVADSALDKLGDAARSQSAQLPLTSR